MARLPSIGKNTWRREGPTAATAETAARSFCGSTIICPPSWTSAISANMSRPTAWTARAAAARESAEKTSSSRSRAVRSCATARRTRSSRTCPIRRTISSARAAAAAGATSTLRPRPGRCRALQRPVFPARSTRLFWSSNCSRMWVWSASRTSANRRFFPSRPTRTRRSQTTILRRSTRIWVSSTSLMACRS